MRLAVVGHIEWLDFVPIPAMPQSGEIVHAVGAFERAAGGGGVVAGVFAELGAEVDFYTALGRDAHGEAAVAQFARRGVRMHVAWREQPTRRAVTLLERDGDRTIITIGERLDPLGTDPLPWELLREADGVYLTAGDAAALVHARQARIVVASPRARRALEGAGPVLDAIVFSGRDRDEREWVNRIGRRARLRVATEGARGGSWEGESSGSWSAAAPPGEPRDAYGCGDSFAAGFTAGLAQGLTVTGAAQLGAQRGALCLTRAGAP